MQNDPLHTEEVFTKQRHYIRPIAVCSFLQLGLIVNCQLAYTYPQKRNDCAFVGGD